MPITGTFLADFASFHDAVQKADVELKGMETSAGKVGKSLNRMVDDFSGRKLIQEAVLAAEAVERIGGTSKLTEAELAKVTRQATEAAAKLRAMGHDVPPGIANIAAQAKTAGGALDSMKGIAGSLAGALGLAFSVGAVVNFGKRVLDTAGQINDLSSQLGISTDAVQGFKFAAEQSGSSLDAVGSAITKMNVNLAGGEKSTVQALKDAGLRFQDIRAMKPEDAFLTIADSIQKIEDPMKRSDIAVALFGKSAAELLPAIQEGFRNTADAADKMSQDTIKRLDEAGDAWAKFTDKVVIYSGEVLGTLMRDAERAQESWPKFFLTMAALTPGFGNQFRDIVEQMDRAADRAKKVKDVHLELPGPVRRTQEEIAAAARASAAYAKELQNIIDKISGADLARQVEMLAAAYNSPNWKASEESLRRVGLMAEALRKNGATLTPQLTQLANATIDVSKALPPVVSGWAEVIGTQFDVTESARELGVVVAGVADPILALLPISEQSFGVMATKVTKAKSSTEELRDSLQALSGSLANLAQVAGGSFGQVASGLSTLVGSIDAAQQGITAFGKGMDAFKDGSTLKGIAGMASGIAGIVTAAIQAANAIKAIWNAFDRNKGRDLVKEFAESFGGFDQLHKELQTLGEEGEALWIKLTQGVGRNNPEQAQRVIEEVEAALARQRKAQEEATISTEEGARATIETATEAQKELDKLSGRLVENAKEWDAWSDAVMEYIRDVANSIRSLPPLPPNYTPSASGTGTVQQPGRIVNPGAGGIAYHPPGSLRLEPIKVEQHIHLGGHEVWTAMLEVGAEEGIL